MTDEQIEYTARPAPKREPGDWSGGNSGMAWGICASCVVWGIPFVGVLLFPFVILRHLCWGLLGKNWKNGGAALYSINGTRSGEFFDPADEYAYYYHDPMTGEPRVPPDEYAARPDWARSPEEVEQRRRFAESDRIRSLRLDLQAERQENSARYREGSPALADVEQEREWV